MFETLPDKVKAKKGKKGKMQIMLMALGKMSEPKK
jgi:hypothetical protein